MRERIDASRIRSGRQSGEGTLPNIPLQNFVDAIRRSIPDVETNLGSADDRITDNLEEWRGGSDEDIVEINLVRVRIHANLERVEIAIRRRVKPEAVRNLYVVEIKVIGACGGCRR